MIPPYSSPNLPPEAFRISPSQIAKFFEMPSVWYTEQVLGEKQFFGSTATELGTITHYIAEQSAKGVSVTPKEVEEYISSIENLEVDKDVLLSNYTEMGSAVVNQYVATNVPDETEYETSHEIAPGIYIAGTVDFRVNENTLYSNVLGDYKTASTKPNTDNIPWKYFIQLMAYAIADKARGIHTDTLRIVYIVKRTKTLPVRVFVVNKLLTPKDWDDAADAINLIVETIQTDIENPMLRHLLFKSMSLKQGPTPTEFPA